MKIKILMFMVFRQYRDSCCFFFNFQSFPKGLFRGFSYPGYGTVLYWNRVLDESIGGTYRLHCSRVELLSGFDTLCNELEIVDSNVILVKIELMDLGIAL